MATVAAHLLGAQQSPIEEPGRDLRFLRRNLDLDRLPVTLGEGCRVADRQTVRGEHQEAVGLAVEAGLDEVVGDAVQSAVGDSGDCRVVGRDEIEDPLGIVRLRSPDGVPVR